MGEGGGEEWSQTDRNRQKGRFSIRWGGGGGRQTDRQTETDRQGRFSITYF